MSSKINEVKALNFGSYIELVDQRDNKENEIRLNASTKIEELKSSNKLLIKALKKEKLNNYKEEIAQIKSDQEKVSVETKQDAIIKIEENIAYYNQLIESASQLEKSIAKKSEIDSEKKTRLNKISKIKSKKIVEVKKQKELLLTLDKSSEEAKTVKNNIKVIKSNASLEIEQLNKTVKFNFFVTLGKSILNGVVGFGLSIRKIWRRFSSNHPGLAQFLIFFLISNGMTVLQIAMMPIFKSIFNQTNLINISIQFGQVGSNINGSPYYMFDYIAGPIVNGIGGGLAYFLAMQVTLAIAQIINFFTQRNVTFKSDSNIWVAAMWYFLAYVVITIVAAALQGLYKAPIYNLFMNTWNMGGAGEFLADTITVILNSAISFWVFFPIFKIIFKQKEDKL